MEQETPREWGIAMSSVEAEFQRRCTQPAKQCQNQDPTPTSSTVYTPHLPGGPALGAAGRKGDGRLWAGRASPSPLESQPGGGRAPYAMSGLGIVGAAG